jgi:hypothetical protein
MGTIRWRSLLGASVVLFLLYAAANMAAALMVPTTPIRGGAGATGLVLDPDADAYLAGLKHARRVEADQSESRDPPGQLYGLDVLANDGIRHPCAAHRVVRRPARPGLGCVGGNGGGAG